LKESTSETKPFVVSILACDSIVQQMPTGKPSLIGVFDQINASESTGKFRPFVISAKLFGGTGKYRIGLHIETPGSTRKPVEEKPVADKPEIECSPDGFQQLVATVNALDVSKPGIVRFFVTLDGETIGDPCPIQIIHTTPKDVEGAE